MSEQSLREEYTRRRAELDAIQAQAKDRGIDLSDTVTPKKAGQQIADLMKVYGINNPWTSKELDEAKIDLTYLVEDVLVEDQPAVIAASYKTMKTSTSIDLALSLARPSRFLDRFWVPSAKKVLFLSAESGESTIQETARRIAKSKGFELSDDENVTWGFWVPKARNDEQLQVLEHQLDESQATVVVIDPLYQVLDGEDQANLSLNGDQIQAVTKRCIQRGVTPILVDHVKRSSENAKNHKPVVLGDVTGSGKAEFFRQWILLSRREEFNPETPLHRLWMSVGGSAGHCGLYAVDIDETRDEGTKLRTWTVSVDLGSSVSKGAKVQKESKRSKRDDRREPARHVEINFYDDSEGVF